MTKLIEKLNWIIKENRKQGQKRPAPVSASAASQDSTPSTAPPAAALPP